MLGDAPTAGRDGAVAVRFDHVTKVYPGGGRPAVRELDLEVPAGQVCVFVGPSGCGKTTAMRMVNRTVEPTAGDIRIAGVSVRDRPAAELRREIGYVIQQIGLFPHRTVAANVATVPRLLGWDRDRTKRRVAELLAMVGLDPDLGDRYPAQLSGGQQQRVGVARALAADPPLLLMDEPFGAVDPINRERLQNELLRLQAELRKTILFVTHDIDEALKMGDRIAVMKDGGRLAQYAPPEELLASPADGFVEDFVGADRALKRLALLRVRDVDLWQPLLARPGEPAGPLREQLRDADVPYPLLVDAERRPLGWLAPGALDGDKVPPSGGSPEPLLELDDVLRDALSDLLQCETQFAPVTDPAGRVAGVLSLELISEFLAPPREAADA